MATTLPPAAADATPAHGDAVQDQLSGIRGLLERQARDQDSRARTRIDRILGVIGSILVPAGIVSILLGWYGAARTPYTFEQIPYVISGGLLGVALVIGGGLLFFGSWVARLEQGNDTDALLASVERLREELARGSASGRSPTTNGTRPQLVATPTGTMLHRLECSVVASRTQDQLVTVAADSDGYQPCKLCGPLDD